MQREMTSPRKIAKAAHKIYRKEMRKEAEQIGQLLGNAMKPKPKWIPWAVWMWMVGFFIKTKKRN